MMVISAFPKTVKIHLTYVDLCCRSEDYLTLRYFMLY